MYSYFWRQAYPLDVRPMCLQISIYMNCLCRRGVYSEMAEAGGPSAECEVLLHIQIRVGGGGANLRPGYQLEMAVYRAQPAEGPWWRKRFGRRVILLEGGCLPHSDGQCEGTISVHKCSLSSEQVGTIRFRKAQISSVGKVTRLRTERTSNSGLVLCTGKTYFLLHRIHAGWSPTSLLFNFYLFVYVSSSCQLTLFGYPDWGISVLFPQL
jgi:hypothetical protein